MEGQQPQGTATSSTMELPLGAASSAVMVDSASSPMGMQDEASSPLRNDLERNILVSQLDRALAAASDEEPSARRAPRGTRFRRPFKGVEEVEGLLRELAANGSSRSVRQQALNLLDEPLENRNLFGMSVVATQTAHPPEEDFDTDDPDRPSFAPPAGPPGGFDAMMAKVRDVHGGGAASKALKKMDMDIFNLCRALGMRAPDEEPFQYPPLGGSSAAAAVGESRAPGYPDD